MTDDEMVRWHHGLSGEEFDQAPGNGEGQSSQTGYSSWGCKDLDTTEQLSNNKFIGRLMLS